MANRGSGTVALCGPSHGPSHKGTARRGRQKQLPGGADELASRVRSARDCPHCPGTHTRPASPDSWRHDPTGQMDHRGRAHVGGLPGARQACVTAPALALRPLAMPRGGHAGEGAGQGPPTTCYSRRPLPRAPPWLSNLGTETSVQREKKNLKTE